jgi:hypothetical protein
MSNSNYNQNDLSATFVLDMTGPQRLPITWPPVQGPTVIPQSIWAGLTVHIIVDGETCNLTMASLMAF